MEGKAVTFTVRRQIPRMRRAALLLRVKTWVAIVCQAGQTPAALLERLDIRPR